MTTLAIRTDRPQAEVYLYANGQQLAAIKWEAHRELAETIHARMKEILNKSSISMEELGGIVCYKGPGSFTGLRIGLSVANALAYSLHIPVVAKGGGKWREDGIKDLESGKNDKIAFPEYGAAAHITKPRK